MGKVCPECGETFDASAEVCPHHGTQLEEEAGGGSDQLVGEVVDERFRLDSVLGEGGMGKVYEATQLSVERQVAVKMIRTRGLQDEEITQRFMREARVISGFSHPNIVRLIDFGEDEELGLPYLAMEYLDGLELTELIEDSRLHPNFALEVTSQIGAALVEAHDAGIVHRDLKTDNVLLMPVSSGTCQVKVIDFGIAFPEENNENLTQTGMICGTPHYLSPEQARGDEVAPTSDLYSLGVILFEMATGKLPFNADSPFNIMVKHVQEAAPSLTDHLGANEVPASYVELVDDMLQKDPADRPETGREIRRRIEAIRDETDWDPIRLTGTEPLRDEVAPWLLSKTVNDSSEIAFDETVGTDQGAGTSNPGTVDQPLAGSNADNSRPGTDPSRNGTGQQPRADRSTPGTGQRAPAKQTTPGTGARPGSEQSRPGTGQQQPADRSTPSSNTSRGPVTGSVPQSDGGGADTASGGPYEADAKPNLDVDDPGDNHVKTLVVVATSLFLLVGGLGLAAFALSGDSDDPTPRGAAGDDPEQESTTAPAEASADDESAAADDDSESDDEIAGSEEDLLADDDSDEEGDDSETAEDETETATADDEPESGSSDESTANADDSGQADSTGTTAPTETETGSKPDDEPDRTGGNGDPSGGSAGGGTGGSDDSPAPPSSDNRQQPSDEQATGSSSDSKSDEAEDVDEEYEETVDWLTNE